MITLSLNETEQARFWNTVTRSSGCWICRSNPSGIYARIEFHGRAWMAHIVSYILANGGLEDGKIVAHSCDTPRCVRPDHLFAKTHSENMQEMVSRKRHKPRFGLDNNLGKLTDEAVISICDHLRNKTRTIGQLAKDHNVTFQCIWRIGRGHGRSGFGDAVIELRPVRKLSVEDVMDMRQRALNGESQTAIAASYGVWPANVSSIVRGVKRRDVAFLLPS